MDALHNKPVFPLLEIYKHHFDLIKSVEVVSRCKASFFLFQYKHKNYFFDADGSKWHYIPEPVSYKATPLKKILAYLGFSPVIDVIPIFSKIGNYELNELKSVLKNCVDDDDDHITQFEEGDIIKAAIDQASDSRQYLLCWISIFMMLMKSRYGRNSKSGECLNNYTN